MEWTIVVITGRKGEDNSAFEPKYHGLFASGDAASRWAFANCDRAFFWHWEEISIQTDEAGVIEVRV